MRINRFLRQFNWRFLLVRILVNAIAVVITAAVTPKIYFVDKTFFSWLLIAVMLGVLNALLKPVLQFLTLQFIFVTYGLVIVLVNALILWLLSVLFPARFAVDNLWWALVGGLVLGLLSSFLESLLGLTMPIVPEEEAALRRQLEEEARHVDWLVAARHEAAQEEQALAVEPPAGEAEATGPVMAESARVEDVAAEAAVAEAPTAEDVVADIAVTEPVAVEPAPPVADEEPVPTDEGVSTDAEPARERGEGQEEDRS
jgi:putative membrane protein